MGKVLLQTKRHSKKGGVKVRFSLHPLSCQDDHFKENGGVKMRLSPFPSTLQDHHYKGNGGVKMRLSLCILSWQVVPGCGVHRQTFGRSVHHIRTLDAFSHFVNRDRSAKRRFWCRGRRIWKQFRSLYEGELLLWAPCICLISCATLSYGRGIISDQIEPIGWVNWGGWWMVDWKGSVNYCEKRAEGKEEAQSILKRRANERDRKWARLHNTNYARANSSFLEHLFFSFFFFSLLMRKTNLVAIFNASRTSWLKWGIITLNLVYGYVARH